MNLFWITLSFQDNRRPLIRYKNAGITIEVIDEKSGPSLIKKTDIAFAALIKPPFKLPYHIYFRVRFSPGGTPVENSTHELFIEMISYYCMAKIKELPARILILNLPVYQPFYTDHLTVEDCAPGLLDSGKGSAFVQKHG